MQSQHEDELYEVYRYMSDHLCFEFEPYIVPGQVRGSSLLSSFVDGRGILFRI